MFPIRELHQRLKVSKPTAYRIRANDADYAELVIEYDVGGVTMGDEDRLELYVDRKRERAEAERAAGIQPKRPGRPRKSESIAA